MRALPLAALGLATVFIVIGTSLNWDVYKNYQQQSFDGQSAHQYTFLDFPFALGAAIINFVSISKGTSSRAIWRYLFYGLLYFIVVQGPSKLQTVDDYREVYALPYSQFTSAFTKDLDQSDLEKLFAGAILNYIGLLLCLVPNNTRQVCNQTQNCHFSEFDCHCTWSHRRHHYLCK